jgi:protein associated with RNAse G/E
MQAGERIQVRAYKADGTCYRWGHTTVEEVGPGEVVTISPADHPVEGVGGSWTSKHAIRAYYWTDRWYNVLEVYAAGGRLEEIYVNVSSPVEVVGSLLKFTDYELDVSRVLPGAARIVDQEEFREAAVRYGYSEPFRRACYQVAREAVEVANGWEARGMPGPPAGG